MVSQFFKFKVKFIRFPLLVCEAIYLVAFAEKSISKTHILGVMSARGLMENPALFAGYASTPAEAVDQFMTYAMQCPLPYKLLLHHLSEMTGRLLTKKQRIEMLACRDALDLIDWLRARGLIK